ncbi:hypothetical protein [Actinomadura sp. NPDC000600]|uniref:hypothetical protein n=1 Tax=Actinomadura sp. NPDC000600 TaxID=3154262 RepID=UPI00339B1B33
MIVVYGGRRPSESQGQLPADCLPAVEERLDGLLADLQPRLAVGSAAAGTDLLAAASALRAGAAVELLVTSDTDEFVAASVADKGAEWTDRYHVLTAAPRSEVIEQPGLGTDDDGFGEMVRRILAHAEEARRDGEELTVVIVSAGRRPGRDHSEDMADIAARRGHRVVRVDPRG